jgi:alcohol dehydrogenase, propanol-preferring
MNVMVLEEPRPIEERPLNLYDVDIPEPGPGEVRLIVKACGVCRTDLHICEGELKPHKLPVVPGHQVVGTVEVLGPGVTQVAVGERVGLTWLYRACGRCKFCQTGRENLCVEARFTGYDEDGGFAEYVICDANYIFPIPGRYGDSEAAPLLCAGVIGYQAYQATGLAKPGKLGLFGFGSSAHILIQIARHLGHDVYVVSRTKQELDLARRLGAFWTGSIDDDLGAPLDAVIVFAPSGELMVRALEKVDAGGRVVSAGIYASPLPTFDYAHLWPEKCLCSIAHTSRESVRQFLKVASEFKIKTEINEYPLADANQALLNIKNSTVSGSTVLTF